MSIKRLGVFQRSKALVLLKNGNSVEQTVDVLRRRYHPNESVEAVKRGYFPASGAYAIARFEHASRGEIVAALENMKVKRDEMKKNMQDPKFRQARREGMKRLFQNPEALNARKELSRRTLTRIRNNPEFVQAMRESIRKLHENPEYAKVHKARASATLTRLHKDPEFERRLRERMHELNQKPEFKEAARERKRKLYQDPEYMKAHTARVRKLYQDPEFRRKRRQGIAKYWRARHLKNIEEEQKNIQRVVSEMNHEPRKGVTQHTLSVNEIISALGSVERYERLVRRFGLGGLSSLAEQFTTSTTPGAQFLGANWEILESAIQNSRLPLKKLASNLRRQMLEEAIGHTGFAQLIGETTTRHHGGGLKKSGWDLIEKKWPKILDRIGDTKITWQEIKTIIKPKTNQRKVI